MLLLRESGNQLRTVVAVATIAVATIIITLESK